MQIGDVCLFFYVKDRFLIHSCTLDEAEEYGDFRIYPDSHMDIWDAHYLRRCGVDFDYYPRGRVVYRQSDKTYLIYYDRCLREEIGTFADAYYPDARTELCLDEHYQCHRCNRSYIV